MAKSGLKDPVQDKVDDVEKQQEDFEDRSFDIKNLKLSEFKTLSSKSERQADPFDGYPKRKVVIEGVEFNLTHLVALRPNEEPAQDPSGRNLTIEQEEAVFKDGALVKKIKKGPKIVTIKTTHNRVVKSFYDGMNYDVVFDRMVEISDGVVLESCAIVKDNSIRAQICFMTDSRTSKTLVDRRYMLPDNKQAKRLRRLFDDVSFNKLKAQRASEKFDADEES